MFPLRPAKAGTRPGILILLSGDIETNPGPTYICSLCNNRINNRQISILCNSNSPHWVHKSCTNITLNHYRQTNGTWTCTLHPANTSAAPHPNPNTNSPIAPQIPAPPTASATAPSLGAPHSPSPSATAQPTPSRNSNRTQTTGAVQPNSNTNHLKILQININDMRTKLTELQHLANNHEIDIISIQESKLNRHQAPDTKNKPSSTIATTTHITLTQHHNPPLATQ